MTAAFIWRYNLLLYLRLILYTYTDQNIVPFLFISYKTTCRLDCLISVCWDDLTGVVCDLSQTSAGDVMSSLIPCTIHSNGSNWNWLDFSFRDKTKNKQLEYWISISGRERNSLFCWLVSWRSNCAFISSSSVIE